MSAITVILQFVLVIGLLIFFHEMGHFLASKLLGIEIEEFGFGYPPRMLKLFTWKGTDVTLNWIPFGGFVRPKGEGDETVPGGMASAPAWKRLIVLLSGVFMNFVIGLIVLVIMFSAIGTPVDNRVLITEIAPNSPAASAQLQANDVITAVNGAPIENVDKLVEVIGANIGQEIAMTVERGAEELTLTLTPRVNPPAGEGAVGIGLSSVYAPMSFGSSVSYAFKTFGYQARETLMLPVNLIRGTLDSDNARIIGIKGIYDLFNNATELDQSNTAQTATPLPIYRLSVIASVSIAFGLTNLLPIPALDGGQIVLLLPELLFKKRVPQKFANALNSVFFILLIFLMIFITIQDFIKPVIIP